MYVPLTVLYDVMQMGPFNRSVIRTVTTVVFARLAGTEPEPCVYNEIWGTQTASKGKCSSPYKTAVYAAVQKLQTTILIQPDPNDAQARYIP